LQIQLPEYQIEFIRLSPDQLRYEGGEILTQFRLVNYSMFVADKDSSCVKVQIGFQRMIFYHLTNTYLPTTR
jgi:hypothetical protein